MSHQWPHQPDDDGDRFWEHDKDEWEEDDCCSNSQGKGEGADYWYPDNNDEDREEPMALYTDFTEIPAWHSSHLFALKVAHLTRKIGKNSQRHPAVINLRRQSYLSAVDIAAGHDQGYRATGLENQLKRCSQALRRIHLCLALIECFERLGESPASACRDLFDSAIDARDSLVFWMEVLRNY